MKNLLLLLCLLVLSSFADSDFTGENLLSVLGMNTSSKEFSEVYSFWLLDKNLENSSGGIKLVADNATGTVTAAIVAGANFTANKQSFSPCTSKLPWGISLKDNLAGLVQKLGSFEKTNHAHTYCFKHGNILVDVTFNDASVISSLKFYNPNPAAMTHIAPVAVPPTAPAVKNAFKQAILNVFSTYRLSGFYSVKATQRNSSNFWHYKYTYNTKLKIPGEQYNLLYSFPFINSPLDFVSVVKESYSYDASFENSYRQYEKKLMDSFPAADGWVATCIPNKESKTVSDLQFTNNRYGSVILDYSKNPKGKHILFIRFLLYSS